MNIPRATQSPEDRRARGRGRRLFWIIVLAAVVVTLGAARPGRGQSRGHRAATGIHASLLDHQEHLDWRLDWSLRYFDVDVRQRTEIGRVAATLATELAALQQDRAALTRGAIDILSAEVLDDQALASLRQEVDDLARRAATDSYDALVEAARQLQPAQRRALVEAWQGRR